jgi:arabinogalactan endo-1,4-beta-galactosidase
VDLSFVQQIEDVGGKYKENSVEKDALDIFKEHGANYVRLRIWHTPANGYCGLEKTLAYAQRVKAKGFKLLIDFHYSDSWADPGKQTKPAAWASLTFTDLKDSVYAYTKYVIEALKNQNALPDMVQIGNEIIAGMLWPDGRVPTSNPTLAWQQFGELVKSGIQGARDAIADTTLKIMIHIDRGGDNSGARWFYDNLIAQGVQFDIIGLSYYPWWHGSLTQMKDNLNDLATRYNKDIIIAEAAYPWTSSYVNDGVNNIGVDPTELPSGYAISVTGQKAFLFTLKKIIKEITNQRGIGFFYWEPAYISVSPLGSSWEHLTTFDFNGNVLSTITAFMNFDTIQSTNVKIRINTATNPDTLKPSGVVQIRGEIKGIGSSFLPSGELVTWDTYTQLLPVNINGDYWDYQFKMYPSDRFEYKFWTGHTSAQQTYWNIGNEGKVLTYDSSTLALRLLIAGIGDTLVPIQFYSNSLISSIYQYYSPFQAKQDSIGVLFRVNVSDLMNRGLFDPVVHGPIVVRGDSANSAGVLNWTTDNIILSREAIGVAGASFWSGIGYFPRTIITEGTQIAYKYFIENSSFGGCESNIADRTFAFPQNDTTLAWQFFNNKIVPTAVIEQTQLIPIALQLSQNFPNPFNPTTTIYYSIPERNNVTLSIYDLLGQKIKTLVNEVKESGSYSISWMGNDDIGNRVVSGVYFLRLISGGASSTKKMILLR